MTEPNGLTSRPHVLFVMAPIFVIMNSEYCVYMYTDKSAALGEHVFRVAPPGHIDMFNSFDVW